MPGYETHNLPAAEHAHYFAERAAGGVAALHDGLERVLADVVDDARDLREKAFFAPVKSKYKVYIIDEAHMVTTQGFNALLKLVEEPPPHLRFIFATTEPDKVLPTIRSRAQDKGIMAKILPAARDAALEGRTPEGPDTAGRGRAGLGRSPWCRGPSRVARAPRPRAARIRRD